MVNFLDIIKYRKTEVFVLLILVFELTFPYYGAYAQETKSIVLVDYVIKSAKIQERVSIEPEIIYQVIKTYHKIPITAYSSTVDQCDDTPCITANGFDVCEHDQEDVLAANFLPFGTKVRIPEIFGDRVFTVQDRMNARYYYRADVWMRTREDAKRFGIVYTTIEVLE